MVTSTHGLIGWEKFRPLIVCPANDGDKIRHKGGDFAFKQRSISDNDVDIMSFRVIILSNN